MEKTEIYEEVSSDSKGSLAEIMVQLTKEAENTVEEVAEEVRQELMDEIAIIRDQFEKKKKQIMDKAKKNAANKTSAITNKVMEKLTDKIEQMSTNKISSVFEQADHKIEDLAKLEPTPKTEVHEEVISDTTLKEKTDTPITDSGKVVETQDKDEIEISTLNVDNETESKQSFEDWFTQ